MQAKQKDIVSPLIRPSPVALAQNKSVQPIVGGDDPPIYKTSKSINKASKLAEVPVSNIMLITKGC